MKEKLLNTIGRGLHHITPVRLVVIVFVLAFFWFVVLGDKGVYQLRQLLNMKYKLLAERQKLNDDVERLSYEKEMLSDTNNLEMVIRQELGYIKPGEVVFEKKKR